MSINVDWHNPYKNRRGAWYKGNLHTHTSPGSPCGSVPPEQVVALYEKAGCDFLAISDHMFVERRLPKTRLALIPGIEWNSEQGEHTGVVSLNRSVLERATRQRDHARLLRSLARADALVILNHPNWQETSHYRREQLDRKWPFDGIEIYNAVIERLAGAALATDKWDYLLARNRRVLGFASDDSHVETDVGQGWFCVRAAALTAAAILRGVRQGNFYCSSGVVFTDIRRQGDLIAVETENAEEIQAIVTGGRRVARVNGKSMCFDVSQARLSGGYVRFTAFGRGSTMGWTQPFFLG
ncbi:MAG: CehA/McbA family metallohydrolase [Verrucomicrobiota bacterium]|nr:CehA/McbA family metallohydrolase [Verrucomicrobiota bacterium]